MVERGPYVSYANCGLSYHVGDAKKEATLYKTSEYARECRSIWGNHRACCHFGIEIGHVELHHRFGHPECGQPSGVATLKVGGPAPWTQSNRHS